MEDCLFLTGLSIEDPSCNCAAPERQPSKSQHFIVISPCLLLRGRILAETSVSSRDEKDEGGRGEKDRGMEGSTLTHTSPGSVLIATLAQRQRRGGSHTDLLSWRSPWVSIPQPTILRLAASPAFPPYCSAVSPRKEEAEEESFSCCLSETNTSTSNSTHAGSSLLGFQGDLTHHVRLFGLAVFKLTGVSESSRWGEYGVCISRCYTHISHIYLLSELLSPAAAEAVVLHAEGRCGSMPG